jgi:hypothetical protein
VAKRLASSSNIFFLKRHPAELRITLDEDDHQNMQALAKKADVLWSLHGTKISFSASVASLSRWRPSPLTAQAAVAGSMVLEVMAAAVSRPGLPGVVASRVVVSRRPSQSKAALSLSPRSWPGSSAASAWPISTMVTRLTPAWLPATSETGFPGAS